MPEVEPPLELLWTTRPTRRIEGARVPKFKGSNP